MLSAEAVLGSQDHGYLELASAHEPHFCGLGGQLIHAYGEEVHVHDLGYGSHAGQGQTYCRSSDSGFGDWCVSNTFGAEFVEQSSRDLVDAVEYADFFS